MNLVGNVSSDLEPDAYLLPVEAYISPEYAKAEKELLWRKVWQVACREEEIPEVGDYITYDIMDQSVIVVRAAPDRIAAYHNVCQHRGRRLADGAGNTSRFTCKFHGWQWDTNGENVFVACREDFGDSINAEKLRLPPVKTGNWAGYVFVNFDPDCEPLADYLDPVPYWLDPFEIDKMRYRWRQWLIVPCNWKVALEAFNESYHVPTTHPQLLQYGGSRAWARVHGKHGLQGTGGSAGGGERAGGATTSISTNSDIDPRKLAAEFMEHLYETVNATTTQTIVDAARKLVDVIPEGTPANVVMGTMMQLAKEADAERGVVWPEIDPEHLGDAGIAWHVFPNSVLLQGVTFLLGYRARPNGVDPDSCIFEVYVLERYPEGEEPRPENVFKPDWSVENWRIVLNQDFVNMGQVQRGMKSWGFAGARPNPHQELAVTNFHRALAEYMRRGAPIRVG